MSENRTWVRLPAWAYWVEREFGEKVPQCPRCQSEDLWRNYARASYNCEGCGWELSDHAVRWVPADVSARTAEERRDV